MEGGHQPVEARSIERADLRLAQLQGRAVVVLAGGVAVADGQRRAAHGRHLGRLALGAGEGLGADEVLAAQADGLVAVLFQPALERIGRGDHRRRLAIEAEAHAVGPLQGAAVQPQIGIAQAMAQPGQRFGEGVIARDRRHVVPDLGRGVAGQRFAHEDRGGVLGIDALVGYLAPVAQGQAAPGHGLRAHHLPPLGMPAWIAVAALDPLAGEFDHPFRIDRRAQPGEQARGLDHLARHQPRWRWRRALAIVVLARAQRAARMHRQLPIAAGLVEAQLTIVHQHVAEHA